MGCHLSSYASQGRWANTSGNIVYKRAGKVAPFFKCLLFLKHIINVTSRIHGARQGLEFCEMLLRPSRQNKKLDGSLYLILHPFDGETQRGHFDLSCSVTWSTTSFWSTILARKRQKGDVALVSLAMKLPTRWMLNPYLEWSCIFS